MKTIRYTAWILIAIFAAVLAWITLNQSSEIAATKMGAPFALVKTDSSPITDKDMLGKPHLIFFGFTHCPEICPTTLFEATTWLEKLGTDADKLDVYFVSIDPERDTPEFLKTYLSAFDPRITGITGSAEEIDKIAKGYHVYYRKVPLNGEDYTMDHTASVYMMKPDGSFMGTIAYQENIDTVMEKLRRLIKS